MAIIRYIFHRGGHGPRNIAQLPRENAAFKATAEDIFYPDDRVPSAAGHGTGFDEL
jgi:hypothetical protein